MNFRNAASLIESEYLARKTDAEERYRAAMEESRELYEAEKAVRCAMLDGKSDKEIAALEKTKRDIISKLGITDSVTALPRCAVCGDTGRIGGKFCYCVRRRAAKESVGNSVLPFAFSDSDMSVFDESDRELMEITYEKMKIFCGKFPQTKNINLLLIGKVGTGKTFLAAAIANELESRGFGALFLSAFRFNDICLKYHTSFEASRSDGLNALIETDLLVIDDLGTESILKNVTLEYLYTVISERMNAGRHTLITTNLNEKAIEARYGERIVSRLFSNRVCLTVELVGKDLRK